MRSLGLACLIAGSLIGCASTPEPVAHGPVSRSRPLVDATSSVAHPLPPPACVPPREHDESLYTAGGLYAPGLADSAPPQPIDVSLIPEPVPREEPLARSGNRSPYSVLGRSYRVLPSAEGYRETGVASWYGYKFHGRHTSSRELYDMCQFTAAHKTLPLPSWVEVTNLDNGRKVVVRVNDRGPFHTGRIIDLSYAAATVLDMKRAGTARVEVRALAGRGLAQAAAEVERRNRERGLQVLPLDADAVAATEALPAEVLPLPPEAPLARPSTSPGDQPMAFAPARPPPAPAAPGPRKGVQVGSFGERRNAERLLQQLANAGLLGAVVDATTIDGRALWRVRFPPMTEAAAQSLLARITASGLAAPQLFSE